MPKPGGWTMSPEQHRDRLIRDLMDAIIWSPSDAEAEALGTFSYRGINKQRTELLRKLIEERDGTASRAA